MYQQFIKLRESAKGIDGIANRFEEFAIPFIQFQFQLLLANRIQFQFQF